MIRSEQHNVSERRVSHFQVYFSWTMPYLLFLLSLLPLHALRFPNRPCFFAVLRVLETDKKNKSPNHKKARDKTIISVRKFTGSTTFFIGVTNRDDLHITDWLVPVALGVAVAGAAELAEVVLVVALAAAAAVSDE
jgi:hypothetical protein